MKGNMEVLENSVLRLGVAAIRPLAERRRAIRRWMGCEGFV